jgi:hypothetical protein
MTIVTDTRYRIEKRIEMIKSEIFCRNRELQPANRYVGIFFIDFFEQAYKTPIFGNHEFKVPL